MYGLSVKERLRIVEVPRIVIIERDQKAKSSQAKPKSNFNNRTEKKKSKT